MSRINTLLIILTIVTAPMAAQTPESTHVGPDMGALISKLLHRDALTATVKYEAPEPPDMAVGMPMPQGPKLFDGQVDLLHDDGATLAVSRSELPRVAVFAKGKQRVVETRTAGKPFSAGPALTDLLALIDAKAVATAATSARWKEARSDDGTVTHTATLPARIIPADRREEFDPMMMSMAPRVRRIETTVRCDAQGTVKNLTFTVIRSDPQAAVMELMADAMQGGDEGELPMLEMGDPDELHDIDGGRHTYVVTPGPGTGSKRVRRLLAELSQALAGK